MDNLKECYKIINDEEALKQFIEWLPDLKENEVFYVSLFARKKYAPETGFIKSNDKSQLKRFIATKENLLEKIKQLEVPLSTYKLKEIEAPQEALVLYIMPNPRCMKKATKLMGKKCWELMEANNFNIHQEAMSCIQKSKSRGCFVDFDIDTKDIDLSLLKNSLPKECYDIIETKGGYHILVRADKTKLIPKEYQRWYFNIINSYPVDRGGDQLLPVPGCVQSTFTPKFV